MKKVELLNPNLSNPKILELANDVIFVPIQSEEEWFSFRNSGMGGSEIGSALGLNKYESSAELFAKKVGLYTSDVFDNYAMSMGRILEPIVSDLWQYYDPNKPKDNSTHYNKNNGNLIRECYDYSLGYFVNRKYPYLFASPDRIFIDDCLPNVLEIKTISSAVYSSFSDGIPPHYLIQTYAYMMVMECNYAEIAFMIDGRKLVVEPIYLDEELASDIDNRLSEWWAKVEMARKLDSRKDIEGLMPSHESTEAYSSFANKFWSDNGTRGKMTPELESLGDLYSLYKEQELNSKKKAMELSNEIKSLMKDIQYVENERFKISWKEAKDGSRRFIVKKKTDKQEQHD